MRITILINVLHLVESGKARLTTSRSSLGVQKHLSYRRYHYCNRRIHSFRNHKMQPLLTGANLSGELHASYCSDYKKKHTSRNMDKRSVYIMGSNSQLITHDAACKIAQQYPDWASTWKGVFPIVRTLSTEIAHDSDGNALKGYQMPSHHFCEIICQEVGCTFWNFFQEQHHSSTGTCIFTNISYKIAHTFSGSRRTVKSTWGCRP